MITVILAVVLMRLERDRVMAPEAALLTELFVEDMDGQLRESGVGDVVVGKKVGKLVSVLGGRLGALREARASRDREQLEAALARNVTMLEGRDTGALAARVLAFDHQVAALDSRAARRSDLAVSQPSSRGRSTCGRSGEARLRSRRPSTSERPWRGALRSCG
jgi:cytochrome b pre-mRNA-processing protein 3